MNESDRREKTMLDLFDWITDFVADRDDVTADDIRLAIAREFADGPRERDVLLAQYRERAEAAHKLLTELLADESSPEPDGSALAEALRDTHRHIEELERIQAESPRCVMTHEAKERAKMLTERIIALSQNTVDKAR